MNKKDLEYLTIYDFLNKKRLGVNGDGGYVIGILDGESFSRDFINMYKMNKQNCAAFDGTIKKYPYEYTNNITFYRRNISPFKTDRTSNLSYFTDNYNDIFLKMDIEGHEFPWLNSLTEEQLNKFKQIVIEFHGIHDNSWDTNLSDKIDCFRKLSKTHYAIHIHGNNWDGITNRIPNVIEVTYIRKNVIDYSPLLNSQRLPSKLDVPNNLGKPDYYLNFPPFVNSTF